MSGAKYIPSHPVDTLPVAEWLSLAAAITLRRGYLVVATADAYVAGDELVWIDRDCVEGTVLTETIASDMAEQRWTLPARVMPTVPDGYRYYRVVITSPALEMPA